jgi:hypothetical protein
MITWPKNLRAETRDALQAQLDRGAPEADVQDLANKVSEMQEVTLDAEDEEILDRAWAKAAADDDAGE